MGSPPPEELTMNPKPGRQLFVPPALILTALILTAIFLTAGCGKKDVSKAATAGPPPPTVIVEQIEQKTVPIYSEYVGQTKADNTVELRARIEGVLEKVYFREGSVVRKGQLLFTIDKRSYQASLQTAKATQAKAESDLSQAQ